LKIKDGTKLTLSVAAIKRPEDGGRGLAEWYPTAGGTKQHKTYQSHSQPVRFEGSLFSLKTNGVLEAKPGDF